MIRQGKFLLILLSFACIAPTASAQDPSWKTPRACHVARECAPASGGKIFVLYDGNYQAMSLWNPNVVRDLSGSLVAWDTQENALIRTYDRCSGLSDHSIAYVRWCQTARSLIVVYSNGNIDLIDGNDNVVNLSQIKEASIPGKIINDVVTDGTKAYISADFGLVVVDVANQVIEEVYRMKMALKSVAAGEGYLVFAAQDSICCAPKGVNLNDAKTIKTLARGTTCLRAAYQSGNFFVSNTGNLFRFSLAEGEIAPSGMQRIASAGAERYFTDMKAEKGMVMTVRSDGHLLLTDASDPQSSTTQDVACSPYLTGASYDGSTYWLSEGMDGLSGYKLKGGSLQATDVHNVSVESPMRNLSYKVRYVGDRLLVTGGRNVVGSEDLNPFTMSYCEGGTWNVIDEKGALESSRSRYPKFNHWNALDAVQDPQDDSHIFVSAYRNGLEEYKDGKFVKLYNSDNSPLRSILPDAETYYNYVSCSALQYDESGNLWLTQQMQDTLLRVRKPDGSWKAIYHESIKGGLKQDQLLFTSTALGSQRIRILSVNGWINTGLFAFTVNSQLKLSAAKHHSAWFNQSGTRIEPTVYYCLMEDSDGSVWVGTDMGLYIIEDVGALFESGTYQLKQIIINRNDGSGLADYLFDGIPITALALDARGNKWVGTDGSGVYRISGDGQYQQLHYDTSNSPLPSNSINSIAVNPFTGEVAIATMGGLALYDTGEVPPAASLEYDNILIYPNPVNPGYHGLITIKGLTENAEIKILSSSGQIVWYGHSTGGCCRWNGHNRAGNRVSSGIYHVVCSTEDGDGAVISRIVMMK